MTKAFASIRPPAWILLTLTGCFGIINVLAAINKWFPATTFTYAIQPVASLTLAAVATGLTRGQPDRIRHAGDKAIVVGSVIAIWFVLYFSTGIVTTYVSNALATNVQGLLLNMLGFGVTAAALEITRHHTIVLTGRRKTQWFTGMVVLAFALCQLNFNHLIGAQTLADVIKVIVSDIIPALASSLLLTYLAGACGLASQLTYSLGVVAMTILPPIIPKHDWYLLGVTSVLLTIIVYLVVDHTQQQRHGATRRQHTNRALDAMWVISMAALVLFMTGAFAYKPSAIMSNSMQPIFSRGSMVVVQKIKSSMDINVSDIIQYEASDTIITHRVAAINQADDGSGRRVFITKGDNNPSRDEPVNEDQVIGVVRAQVPYIGYPTVWLHEITIGNISSEINGAGT